MAEVLDKILMDEAAGRELANQVKSYVDDNTIDAEALASALTDYAKSTEVSQEITTAIAALEKKIMTGDAEGQVAQAYDTLKEIADWITQHGQEAANLTTQIGQKLDKSEYEADKPNFALKTDLEDLTSNEDVEGMLEEYAKTEEVDEKLEGYVKISDIKTVSTATVQSWFA